MINSNISIREILNVFSCNKIQNHAQKITHNPQKLCAFQEIILIKSYKWETQTLQLEIKHYNEYN